MACAISVFIIYLDIPCGVVSFQLHRQQIFREKKTPYSSMVQSLVYRVYISIIILST